ncbi:MAG: hypothetical protein GWN58_16365, partial [Anaerolineae bacterium]|nr:hypothetical protein [Anaerolineae bacterium]
RAAEEITPAPEPSGSEFDVGDRVRVSTSIGLKEGEVTAVRWDSQREVFRYTVPLDGNSWEYSPSQLTLVTTATVQDPG